MDLSFFKRFIESSPTLWRFLSRIRLILNGQPRWKPVLDKDRTRWTTYIKKAKLGPNILIATSLGSHLAASRLESLLAVALTLRGASVSILLCDSALPACQEADVGRCPNRKHFIRYGPRRDLCIGCFSPAYKMYRSLGINVFRYSEFITADELANVHNISSTLPLEDIQNYRLDGLSIGEHALAGALRFLARGTLDNEPYAESILRQYLKAALITVYVMQHLLEKSHFEHAVFHHGIYVPQGLIREVCHHSGVRVVNWDPAYRKNCFIFGHGDNSFRTIMTEPVEKWINIQWGSGLETELMRYLKSRSYGTQDWICVHHKTSKEDLNTIAAKIGVDFSKPCIGMLTNVMWDAQIYYQNNIFKNMLEWALETIEYFAKRPELQLLVRVHPAEILGIMTSKQLFIEEIKKVFPVLPKNVFIIPPESPISTYAAMLPCNAVIIYSTTAGMELAALGIPIIVGGGTWFRNKGIGMAADSKKDYFRLLNRLPLKHRLKNDLIEQARKYTFHLFFRRTIPIKFAKESVFHSFVQTPYVINVQNISELLPGQDKGLDIICDGILYGKDFIYPAELYI